MGSVPASPAQLPGKSSSEQIYLFIPIFPSTCWSRSPFLLLFPSLGLRSAVLPASLSCYCRVDDGNIVPGARSVGRAIWQCTHEGCGGVEGVLTPGPNLWPSGHFTSSLRICFLSCKSGTFGFYDPFSLKHLMDGIQRKGRKCLSYMVLIVLMECCEAGEVSEEGQRTQIEEVRGVRR